MNSGIHITEITNSDTDLSVVGRHGGTALCSLCRIVELVWSNDARQEAGDFECFAETCRVICSVSISSSSSSSSIWRQISAHPVDTDLRAASIRSICARPVLPVGGEVYWVCEIPVSFTYRQEKIRSAAVIFHHSTARIQMCSISLKCHFTRNILIARELIYL